MRFQRNLYLFGPWRNLGGLKLEKSEWGKRHKGACPEVLACNIPSAPHAHFLHFWLHFLQLALSSSLLITVTMFISTSSAVYSRGPCYVSFRSRSRQRFISHGYTRYAFYYRATARMQRTVLLSKFCPSVCLSVRLSDRRVYYDKSKWRTVDIFIPHETATLVMTAV